MKKTIIVCSLLIAAKWMTAQNIYVSNVDYNKQQQQGTIAEYDFTKDMVSNVLEDEMERTIGKAKKEKGFLVYRGVHVNEISPDAIDLYVKVDRKSKKEKNKALAYVLVSKGYDNFIQPNVDAQVFDNVKTYLTKMTSKMASNDLGKQIEAQEDVVKKEEKKLNNYQDDVQDMEKKIKKLNDDIAEKKKDIETQKQEVSKQQTILQVLKDKKI